jgi:ribulose 1,5-bisphosphate carboxylase large subunit-like protein
MVPANKAPQSFNPWTDRCANQLDILEKRRMDTDEKTNMVFNIQ